MFRRSKGIISLVLVTLLMCVAPVMAVPTVNLDGRQLSFEVPPTIDNGRTLVPLRAIFEPLGAEVQWDGSTRTVTATKSDTVIKLTLGQTKAYVNSQPVMLSVPAKSIEGRTMVPLRFVGEALGAEVNWNGDTQVITILSFPGSGSAPPTITQAKVHFIDVGQADSIYIDLPDDNDILIDGGNVGDGSAVVNYLKSQGVDDIELMIATHPHEDHIGGLPAVLEAFNVEQIIDSGKTATSNIYNTYSAAAKAEGSIRVPDARQNFTWGNVALQILTGNETWQDVNDYSVVTRLDCGNIEFLFTGDAETPVENILSGDISAEILKVGHHGSTSSSSSAFLNKVNPEVAIISVGTGNTYGHPAATTLSKLQGAGATVYRTDLNGHIVVTTDGDTYSVSTAKNLPAPVAPVVTPAPTQPVQSTGTYVGSSKSDKYHYTTCSSAKKISAGDQVWFATEGEADGSWLCAV